MMSTTFGSISRIAALALALGLVGAAPPHPGGGAPPVAPRAPQPVIRAPQPVIRAPQPGFDLHGDTDNSGRIARPQQPAAQPQAVRGVQPIARRAGIPNLHRPVIHNPHNHPIWGWHGGAPWVPVLTFWGGAFWGNYGFESIGAQYPIDFVPVAPGSPGAELLSDYGLTQTDCNADDLVVIDGPDGSVICAYPNNVVAPGTYFVDPTTLTLEST
jgi:hypothetical protein